MTIGPAIRHIKNPVGADTHEKLIKDFTNAVIEVSTEYVMDYGVSKDEIVDALLDVSQVMFKQ